MTVRVSFSEYEKKDFSAIPAGAYPLVVTNVEESEDVGPSGYSYLKWELTIKEGEYENRKLWVNTSLSPKAMFKLGELLEAFGEDMEAYKSEGEIDIEFTNYIGSECVGTVRVTTYNGDLKNEIKSFHPIGYEPPAKGARPSFSGGKGTGTIASKNKGTRIR